MWMSFDKCLSCCTMETREAVMPAMLMIMCSAENGLHDKAGKGQSKHQWLDSEWWVMDHNFRIGPRAWWGISFRGKSLYAALNAGCIDWLRSMIKNRQKLVGRFSFILVLCLDCHRRQCRWKIQVCMTCAKMALKNDSATRLARHSWRKESQATIASLTRQIMIHHVWATWRLQNRKPSS